MKNNFSLMLWLGILLLSHGLFAQSRTVSGQVTDQADGLSLPGVTVRVKGTTVATQTDVNGNYSLQIAGDNDVLIFSFVGVNTLEETVGSRSVVNVALVGNNEILNEVVVVGYGTQKKVNLTGAVDQ